MWCIFIDHAVESPMFSCSPTIMLCCAPLWDIVTIVRTNIATGVYVETIITAIKYDF